MRAEACIKFGAWLDQTQYAIGGLYSSTHPPLIVWMMAFARMIFGDAVFVWRLVSGSSAVIALFFFYKFVSRFFSRWTNLFATVSLGSAQVYIWFGHHAQFDIPMFAFIIASVYFAVKAFGEEKTKFAVIAGVLYGCALLSKALWGLYLIPFLCAFPYIFMTRKGYFKLALILTIALAIAAPWYLWMMFHHPHFSSDYAALISTLKAGTYNPESSSAWWYYLNQTIIHLPLLILLPVVGKPLYHKLKVKTTEDRLFLVSFLWLAVMLIFLSSFGTRMLHYWLFLLLPCMLVLCFTVEQFLQIKKSKSTLLLSSLLIFLSLVWSSSELIRKSLREYSIFSLHFETAGLMVSIIFILLVLVLLYKYFSPINISLLFIMSVFLIAGELYRWANRRDETFINGAETTANILLSDKSIHSLAVYHASVPYESLMPQLDYYTNGWLDGWDSSRKAMTKNWSEIDSLITIKDVPKTDAAILYAPINAFYPASAQEITLTNRIDEGLTIHYKYCQHIKNYIVYWEPRSSQ